MSGLTKKRPIEHTEISVDGKKYTLPKDKKKPVLTLLKALGATNEEKNISAEEVLKDTYGSLPKGAVHLKGARTKEGISQRELMKKTGIPVYNISKMENGSRTIGKELAKRLAKALNIDFKILMEK